MVTCALGIAAPAGSVTVPTIFPDTAWPIPARGRNRESAKAASAASKLHFQRSFIVQTSKWNFCPHDWVPGWTGDPPDGVYHTHSTAQGSNCHGRSAGTCQNSRLD